MRRGLPILAMAAVASTVLVGRGGLDEVAPAPGTAAAPDAPGSAEPAPAVPVSTDDGTKPRPASEGPAPARHEAAARLAEPPSPAPGRAFRAEHDDATAGIVDPLPPADAATWTARRASMDADWERTALEAARDFALAHELTEAASAAVVAHLKRLHADLAGLRAEVTAGRLSPAAFRARAEEVRARTSSAVETSLGPHRAAALRAHLAAEPTGGGF